MTNELTVELIVGAGAEEEEEGRPHPLPGLGAHVAPAGEPGRQLEDGHDRRHQPGRHQLRRNALHSQVS